MQSDYWVRYLGSRISRRRSLQAAGGVGLGAVGLGLLGCGGDDSKDTSGSVSTGDRSGLVSVPSDTTKQAKQGGALKDFLTADIQHFDATISERAAVAGSFSAWCYPRLLKYKMATYPEVADGTAVGDAATSYEISGDKMQLTFKIRQGMKWDSRAPTNGRPLDAQDVLFSWKKFTELNPAASNLYNPRSPSAAITSMEAPDTQTIVVKLVRPDSTVIPGFTAFDHFYVMPRESDGGFNPMTEVRGAGPWQVEEFVPSARMVYRRNPDYYESGRPFPERLECPIIADYSQLLAQFKAGNIYTNVALPQDAIQTKKDSPSATMTKSDRFLTAGNYLNFGFAGNSVFRDKRMRQALSNTIDAEGYVEGIENRGVFESEGVDLEWARNTLVWAGWNDYWLNPEKRSEFGENSKYLHHNIAEAKALMSAAGHTEGAEFTFGYSSERYGAIYMRNAEVFAGMFREAGMKVNQDAVPYQKFQEVYSRDGALYNFSGVTLRAGRAWGSVAAQVFGTLHKDGSIYSGMSPTTDRYEQGDPKVNDLTEKIKLEYDVKKQQDLVHELIRYVTGEATLISQPTTSKAYVVTWPALANFGVFTSYPGGARAAEHMTNWWIDNTKAPLA